MNRAEGTVERRVLARSMRSLLTAVPIPRVAWLLFVVLITASLVGAAGDWLGRMWLYVGVFGASMLAITAGYLVWRFRQRTGAMAASIATLKTNAELFQVAFDFAAIGMALVFPTGRCQRVNRSLCEILGYSDEELLATDFQRFIHPEERKNART